MKSMTGFGKRESLVKQSMIGVEVRSVNHRFCEILVRLPRVLSEMELSLKELVKGVCDRGRVELSVTVNGGVSTKQVRLDRTVAKRYVDSLHELKKTFKLSGTVDVNVLAGFRDIFSTNEENVLEKDAPKAVLALTRQALAEGRGWPHAPFARRGAGSTTSKNPSPSFRNIIGWSSSIGCSRRKTGPAARRR